MDFFPTFASIAGAAAPKTHKLIGRGKTATALMNLEQDIAEKNNRLAEQPDRVEKMMKLHKSWRASVAPSPRTIR
ncbi:MAG: hypothetical protein QGH60_04320 [Phycisphaerae bacterium]|nr:hypothetical protein [Phycisphaerae bacterium]